MKIMHACAPRPGKEGKTFWHRVGTAFLKENGNIGILFDSYPLPDKEGRVNVQLFEPKPRDGEATQNENDDAQSGQGAGKPDMVGGGRSVYDDEIPFAPEFR